MIDALAAGTVLYAVLLALAGGACLVRRERPGGLDAALAMLAAMIAGQAVGDVAGLVAGHRPAEPAVHIAYLVTTVAVGPLALVAVRGDRGRWATALAALAALVIAVLVVRLQTTWRGARA